MCLGGGTGDVCDLLTSMRMNTDVLAAVYGIFMFSVLYLLALTMQNALFSLLYISEHVISSACSHTVFAAFDMYTDGTLAARRSGIADSARTLP